MMKRCFLFLVLLGVLTGGASFAAKRQKACATLVKAGKVQVKDDNGHPKMITNLVIVWNSSTYPESFFWRGENGWLPCRIMKMQPVKKGAIPETIEIENDKIHKGDQLLLEPTPGGKFAVPAEIPATAKNTLYYKTAGSKWHSLKVGKIK